MRLLLLLLLIATACHPAQQVTTDYVKEGFVPATVINYSMIAGCNYLLMLEDEKKLQPKNLEPEFKKDSLKVWIKYIVEDAPNICMTGKVVRLQAIHKRN